MGGEVPPMLTADKIICRCGRVSWQRSEAPELPTSRTTTERSARTSTLTHMPMRGRLGGQSGGVGLHNHALLRSLVASQLRGTLRMVPSSAIGILRFAKFSWRVAITHCPRGLRGAAQQVPEQDTTRPLSLPVPADCHVPRSRGATRRAAPARCGAAGRSGAARQTPRG